MSYVIIIIAVCIILLILYAVQLYNGLVLLKHNIDKAWGNIEILLKQRNNELAKLIMVCRQHIKYEAHILDQVVSARADAIKACDQADINQLNDAETTLRQSVQQLFLLAEQYPELKSVEGYKYLQNRISTLETHIADRRELYNESVNLNNVRIEQFPDRLLAKLFNFTKADLFDFSAGELTRSQLINPTSKM